jgi:hypothetical protein
MINILKSIKEKKVRKDTANAHQVAEQLFFSDYTAGGIKYCITFTKRYIINNAWFTTKMIIPQ